MLTVVKQQEGIADAQIADCAPTGDSVARKPDTQRLRDRIRNSFGASQGSQIDKPDASSKASTRSVATCRASSRLAAATGTGKRNQGDAAPAAA